MMQRLNRAWMLSLALLGVLPAVAQGPTPASASSPAPSDKDWPRLRDLVSALITEEGTRKVFSSFRNLGESFASEEHFSYFVAPWRPRLSALPPYRQDAMGVNLETVQRADGTTISLLTYHHQEPANAITIVKTVWQDEELLKVVFMKGFSNVPDENAARNRTNAREESYRQWAKPTAPVRK